MRLQSAFGTLALLSFQIAAGAEAAPRDQKLLGKLDGDTYVHVSGAFRVRATSATVSDSQSGVEFRHLTLDSVSGWDSISFVQADYSAGKTPRQIIEAIVGGQEKELYRRKRVKPSVAVAEERTVLGRPSLYARVSFPEYPGTGVSIFGDDGRPHDADYVSHLFLVSIGDLGLVQRNSQKVEFLLVTSMRCTSLFAGHESTTPEFVQGIELIAKDRTGDLVRDAIARGDLEALRRLLDGGADPGARDDIGESLLTAAVGHGHSEIVDELLRRGADANAADKQGRTPLMLASFQGAGSIVERLLERGAEVDRQAASGLTALMLAGSQGRLDVLATLISRGAGVNTRTPTGWTALMLTAPRGHVEAVRALLSAGADAKAQSSLDGGTPQSIGGTTALMGAAEAGQVEVVEALLSAGSDVNARDVNGSSSLALAATEGHVAVVQKLVAAGADLDARNKRGKSGLELAREGRHQPVVAFLTAASRQRKSSP